MEWALVISLSLNILSILVYFNIPEFLQEIFIKKIEYKYNIKLDRINKHNEILPELFYTVSEAIAYHNQNYSGNTFIKRDMIKYAKLKNFITKNQFFIPAHIKDLSREIEDKVWECMRLKHDKDKNLSICEDELIKLQNQLEEKIQAILAN